MYTEPYLKPKWTCTINFQVASIYNYNYGYYLIVSANSNSFTNTGTTPTPTTNTNIAVVIPSIIVIVMIVIVVIIITVGIFFYIRSKRSNILNVHGGGDSTLEKALDIELTGLKSDKEGIVIHKEMKHRGTSLESKERGAYEAVTDIIPSRYETVGGGEVKGDRTYSTVDDCTNETYKSRHNEKRKKYQTDQLQGDCSRIDCEESLAGYSEVAQPNNCSEPDDPIYSDPNIANEQTFTSPSGVTLQSKVSPVPHAIENSEYAVIGTTGAPVIPKKSNILVDYLETKSFNVWVDKKPKVSVSDGGNCGADSDRDEDGCSNMNA